jgi:hypothetical protein
MKIEVPGEREGPAASQWEAGHLSARFPRLGERILMVRAEWRLRCHDDHNSAVGPGKLHSDF